MALKIRLSRIGSTHNPIYHVVVAEARDLPPVTRP